MPSRAAAVSVALRSSRPASGFPRALRQHYRPQRQRLPGWMMKVWAWF